MRVKEIADLTGVTVRAIRHYHAIGLVPVPEVRYGWRDYDLSHVARVGRIRWLLESGLPLAKIRSILDEDVADTPDDKRASVLVDLRASLEVLQGRIEGLSEQLERLAVLVATVEQGESLSPLPPAVSTYYDVITGRAPDSVTRLALVREREFLELAYLRGEVPAAAELLFAEVDEQTMASILEQFGDSLRGELTDELVEEAAIGVVERMRSGFGGQLVDVAQTIDANELRRLYALFSVTGSDRDRRMGEAVVRHLLAAIEAAQGT
ncbi:MerR family transcriptional regulator [Mumia zhuanghuii]|uniref:MerR family transcriptional regulator n=1 Tax=Mumia zhuanghuii TaxID=2585211 RepID=UPI001891767F|nr:MerR family transcriptional regulator [Mumia zhuanghuii]